MTQQKTRYTWLYSASRLQSFPPLATRFRGSRDRKAKKNFTKFVSATNVARAGKRGNICVGNNVSATMCPRLPGPLNVLQTYMISLVFEYI